MLAFLVGKEVYNTIQDKRSRRFPRMHSRSQEHSGFLKLERSLFDPCMVWEQAGDQLLVLCGDLVVTGERQ